MRASYKVVRLMQASNCPGLSSAISLFDTSLCVEER